MTTISGKYTPKLSYKSGMYASITIRTTVTNVAMMTIKHGIRTLSGMTLRSSEMMILLQISTNVTAKPIPKQLAAAVVSANVGQVPSTNLKVGFCRNTPSRAKSFTLFFIALPPFLRKQMMFCVVHCGVDCIVYRRTGVCRARCLVVA